jgi:hypothetical protein
LQESDQNHGGRTTIKRKQMVELQNRQEKEEYQTEKLKREEQYKIRKFGNANLGELSQIEMSELRGEIDEITKAKMTKEQQRKLETDKLVKIGAVLRRDNHNRKHKEAHTKNKLERDIKSYKIQKDMGMASGMANPLVVHRKAQAEKYGDKRIDNLKLHKVGKLDKDGTLNIGGSVMKRTTQTLKERRSGGISSHQMFKKFSK